MEIRPKEIQNNKVGLEGRIEDTGRTGKVILKKGHMNRHQKGVRTLAMGLCGLVGGGGAGRAFWQREQPVQRP